MASPMVAESAASKIFTAETLRSAAKQSQGIHLIPLSLRRAIKKYLREKDEPHMNRKVLLLSQSFARIKNERSSPRLSPPSCSRSSLALVDDPLLPLAHRSARWKVRSAYGDIGMKYENDETVAYVASRMPAVYSACHRVLREVRRRLPGFSPAKVLDFGAGPCSALWAMREVWPRSLEQVNLVEPSKEMQRAGQTLLQDLKGSPLIHSYDTLQALNCALDKSERKHDLVISSYALGEIPSLSDRITIVRQLWDLTQDVLVLLEPGTPQGSKIIQQMRSYILWMEKRKCRKNEKTLSKMDRDEKSIVVGKATKESGAFVVAPCSHDGRCPLENSSKYCHFVQRLERTSSQRAYKRSKGKPLRGFEDEKFCYVALRRGKRPSSEAWPLDGMKFETLKEQHAKRNPDDLIIDYEDQFETEAEGESEFEDDIVPYASDAPETNMFHDHEKEEEEEDEARADLGGGWGRIIYMPVRRGRHITMNVCRSTKRDGSEGAFERVVITQSRNPTLHHQARRSLWGDLWPY
ncbi:methyltransferase-like protein 17, mitochondrial [Iris pallida]|uniref:Methyltransferase-like protein 17, mitochondrial n=1 Tax=Iris pallida TaxID=29817 RepID=A0AAX6GWQ7_IRIPA|nr:methyltransferase-like protein 17, mitochondrial [Iris pallida]